jgi:two-component system response regulator RegA
MNILLADDDEAYRLRLARALQARGHVVVSACDGAEAIQFSNQPAIEVAILDLKMPHHSGIDVLRSIMQSRPEMRVLIHTGYGSIASAMEAVRLGAIDYRIKPTDVDALLAAFETDGSEAESESPLVAPSLERVEWEHIQRVMADCQGNISEAARVLGLHRRSLQRKLQKYPPLR